MTSLSVLDHGTNPQEASPLRASPLGRLPPELRILVYMFVFQGCQATAWLDGGYSSEYVDHWQGRRRKVLARGGQCCYEHFDGGFSLLATCRMIHNEALATYWSETVLQVSANVFPRNASCPLQRVCAYLPATIKANLCHLRGTKLPILLKDRPTEGDSNWTPTLLRQLPNLKSCVFFGKLPLAGGLKKEYLLRVPGIQSVTPKYDGVGPFHVDGGVSPASFIEEKLGVRQDCTVMFLSRASGELPRVRPPNYKTRKQYFNYTTGMVYQTTKPLKDEEGFEVVMEAKEDSE